MKAFVRKAIGAVLTAALTVNSIPLTASAAVLSGYQEQWLEELI